MPEKQYDVIQIIPAPPDVYVWTMAGEQTVIDPVPAFALVEYIDSQKYDVLPMTAKDGAEQVVIAFGGILEYRSPKRRNNFYERIFKT